MRIKKDIKELTPYFIDEKPVRFKLDANESPYDLENTDKDRLLAFLGDINLNRYPDPNCKTLRRLVAQKENVEENQIVFGNGSDELLYLLMMCLEEKAVISFPMPGFSMYAISGKIFGKEQLSYELSEPYYSINEESFDTVMRREPHLCYIANPNNPTGNCFPDEILEKYLGNENIIFVSDEAYADFSGKSFKSKLKDFKNLLIMKTFSKIGFASIRLGYLIGNRELISHIEKVRLPYNINSFTQKVAEFYLKNNDLVEQHISDIINERKRVSLELTALGVYQLPSNANFITFKIEKNGFYDFLINNGILVKDLYPSFKMKHYFRFTIGRREENDYFIKILRQFVEEE